MKYVVDAGFDAAVIAAAVAPQRIYLQVESGKAESAAKAYQIVMAHPQLQLRIGVQLHKIINVE